MYHVLAQVDVAPADRGEFISLERALATDCVRTEAGTLAYDIIQDHGNPNRFYAHEAYSDEAAFQAHMQGPLLARHAPRIRALIGTSLIFLGRGFDIVPSGS